MATLEDEQCRNDNDAAVELTMANPLSNADVSLTLSSFDLR